MPFGSIIILVGVACVIGSIVGGGIKLSLPSGGGVDAPVIESIRRQLLLGGFGILLIAGGVLANSGLPLSTWLPAEQTSPKKAPIGSSPGVPPETKAAPTIVAQEKAAPTTGASKAASPVETESLGIVSAKPERKPTESTNIESRTPICTEFGGLDAAGWRSRYLHSPDPGTWHVFVFSLPAGSTEDDANSVAQQWSARFSHRGLDFDPIETVNADTKGNDRWAILIASGLDNKTAAHIARFADQCGVAKGAYSVKMVG